MMTEPTRDEINRALAEGEGWKFVGCACVDQAYITPSGLWTCPRCLGDPDTVPPDYCDSLDAQMPLWERVRVVKVEIDMLVSGRYRAALVFNDGRDEESGAPADTIPEASARALYAVREQEGE